jgi:site-specific DNA recombinase
VIPAAIYARYSTDNQNPRSCDDQIRACRAWVEAHGYAVAPEHVFADRAQSGKTVDRDDLQRMLAFATGRRPPFKALVLDDLSRLARDMGGFWGIVDDLVGAGITVVDVQTGTTTETPGWRAVFGLKSLVADQYLENARYQTHRGLRSVALDGFSTGAIVYGYRSAPEPDARDPEHARRVPVIDEDEAAIVRRIFRDFADGASFAEVRDRLNAEGIRSLNDRTRRPGRGWSADAVGSILRNPRYVGRWAWGLTRTVGRRTVANAETTPDKRPVVADRPDLAIVDRATWDRVQAMLAARKPGRPPGARRVYITSGLFRCGTCGGMMSLAGGRLYKGTRYPSLSCTTARKRGPSACTNGGYVHEGKVSAALVTAIREVLRPELADAFVEGVEEGMRAAAAAPARADAERRLRDAEARVARIAAAIARVPDSEALLVQLGEEEAAVRALRAEAAAARAAAGAPRVAPTRDQVRAAFAAWVTEIAEVDPQHGNALLRRAIGDGGIVVTPSRLAWDCAGALRLGTLLANSGSAPAKPGHSPRRASRRADPGHDFGTALQTSRAPSSRTCAGPSVCANSIGSSRTGVFVRWRSSER